MAILELHGVSKSFSRNGRGKSQAAKVEVLRDINLSIRENEFVCIVGRSGSGKTTLISLIAGLIEADAGAILLEGKPIAGPGPDRGVIFQNYSLLPWMNVFDNVYLAVDAVAPNLADQEKRQRTEYYIDLVNLGAAIEKSSARTFRRHAPAGCGGARPGDGPEGFALGRTLQRPRCADPRHAARRAGAHLDGNPQDRGDDHQRYR